MTLAEGWLASDSHIVRIVPSREDSKLPPLPVATAGEGGVFPVVAGAGGGVFGFLRGSGWARSIVTDVMSVPESV